MLLIGLLLIALAVLFGWAIIVDATEPQTLTVFGVTANTTGAGVFLTGAATMLALLVGLWLIQVAMRRARRRRAEVKRLKREREQAERLEQEKAALAAELERERQQREAALAQRREMEALGPVAPNDERQGGVAAAATPPPPASRRGGLRGASDRTNESSGQSQAGSDRLDMNERQTREQRPRS